MATLVAADAERIASHFGRSREALADMAGMTVQDAASHIGVSVDELGRILGKRSESEQPKKAEKKSATKKTAKRSKAKK